MNSVVFKSGCSSCSGGNRKGEINMKKKYVEPVMIVEDFSMNETIAANSKCLFDVNQMFTGEMTAASAPCKEASDKAANDIALGRAYEIIGKAYDGDLDLDNKDHDNDMLTGLDEKCFTEGYKTSGAGVCVIDGGNMTFLSYKHAPEWESNPLDACKPSEGTNPLQNS